MSIKEKVVEILQKESKRVIREEELVGEVDLIQELAMDSIACINTIVEIENTLGFEFPEDTDFSRLLSNLNSLVKMVENILK